MENQNNKPKRQSKDNQNKQELKKVWDALKLKPLTMLEVEFCTGIRRSNICRRIATLKLQNKVRFIRKRKCTISKHSFVGEYTANPDFHTNNSNQCVINL
ncbi:hypothetical protein G1J88_04370 [Tenacibaculum dicentrarchi]|uniref:hypothetical protein n=1 Tax=Tenacibaculum finnmarkense TaxID=2781243 RepID=UPI001BE651A9|nr:hypothetical protein [Tenacibaculum finnmarkense]MCG8827620.1 hypothetical protein [Tenacibaculum dicentrarchi]MCG8858901.1 hypothetical protein [Tenacibaculum finnmarkense]